MEEFKVKAIVLKAIDYKEKDKIVHLFSLEHGKISAILKGVRSEKAKLKFAAQPFCFADFILVKKGDLFIVTNVDLEDSFFDLTKDLNSYYLSFTLLEMVDVALMEEEANALVFINLLKALKLICYDKVNAKLVVLKFVLGMLKVLGYRFNFNECEVCKAKFINKKFLNLDNGSIVCGSCQTINSKQMTDNVFNLIKALYVTEIERVNTINAKDSVLLEALDLMVKNFEYRTESKLKTLKTL
ncbi:MAG: DNA repair protein RecO [Spirochaetales bacterium]